MAFFRAMGADSVAYHEKTVVGRADDHPGQALNYYGSRGETPLRWGGRLAVRLGLDGEVTPAQYRASFGPGGFHDSRTGEQLTSVKRPGFEWVIGPHKSVAVLGVIGRADDMHAILDAERDASVAFVEDWWVRHGGSRGREQARTATGGLVYAATRHGTTRAGDPHPHDHVLFPNITEMRDAKGGFKALDSAALRDITEAATMVGRLHSAWKAIELGYTIALDQGAGGRARRWRAVGIPVEVCELFSKRADEIARYLEERGQSSYRARNIAARATREVKRHTGVDELLPRWVAELEGVGWSVERLNVVLEEAQTLQIGPRPALTEAEIDAVTAELVDPNGPFMASHKVFNRWNLIEELAPRLYGRNPDELQRVLDRVLSAEAVVPLIGGPYTRQRTYASALVLAQEQTIAATVERLASRSGPDVPREAIWDALARKRHAIGRPLTAGQRAAVDNICGPTGSVKVIVGIAGSGKTTAMDAATTALDNAGYTVLGTATSGQAARTLGEETAIEARTTRSLLWRIDHGHITLDERTVVILDEAGMTTDTDLARILHAAARTHGTVVLVGDPRQLAPVGPGGALAAVLAAHPDLVTTLGQNVRQPDPREATALLEVRHGNPDIAVDFYTGADRVRANPTQLDALHEMTRAWAADTAAGNDTLMVAWRRETVAALNRFARVEAESLGLLSGEDLIAPGGRAYAVGDQVVTLAPNYQGDLVTSQRGTVTAIDHRGQTLTIAVDGERHVHLRGEQLDAEHLDRGYALTVHRTQGATADRTHYLAEGGGRELAYVALSRARQHTTIHVVADDLPQALDDLGRQWSDPQAEDWITRTHQPDPTHAARPLAPTIPIRPPTTRDEIVAELRQLNATAPPDVADKLAIERFTLDQLRQDRDDLETGAGRWRDQPEGHAIRALHAAEREYRVAETAAEGVGILGLRRAIATLRRAEQTLERAALNWQNLVPPATRRLDDDIAATDQRLSEIEQKQSERIRWRADHPAHTQRLDELGRELLRIDDPELARTNDLLDAIEYQAATPEPHLDFDPPAPDLGLEM